MKMEMGEFSHGWLYFTGIGTASISVENQAES
jgi:hypothetical protein